MLLKSLHRKDAEQMKPLIIFYSYSGNTKRIAEALATAESADIAEVTDVNKPGKLKAFTAGCLAAMRGRAWPIQPLTSALTDYERLILLSPVWASNPPPAFNALLEQLPDGKSISVKMVSGSGKSKCKERVKAAIKARGCDLESFEDMKA